MRKCRSVVAQRIGSYRDVLVLREDHPSHEDVFSAEVEDGTIRIKVLACGLDFPTMLVMEGKHMMKKSPPFVPGSDVCGVVSAVGSDARDFDISIGDIVFGVSQTGAMSEYALMLLENAYKVPKGVSPAIAAGFEMNYGTTYHGLVDLANLKKGETLLVLGASGGVGMAAIDIGKALGARVVACASSSEKLEMCRSAGADILINYAEGDFKKALKKHRVYGSVDVVYDPVGGKFSEPSMRALAWGGRFVVIGFASGGSNPKSGIPKIPLNLALLNERKILGVFWGAWKMQHCDENRENMDKMMSLVSSGTLKPKITKLYEINDFMQAFDDMSNRRVMGKVCLAIDRRARM